MTAVGRGMNPNRLSWLLVLQVEKKLTVVLFKVLVCLFVLLFLYCFAILIQNIGVYIVQLLWKGDSCVGAFFFNSSGFMIPSGTGFKTY